MIPIKSSKPRPLLWNAMKSPIGPIFIAWEEDELVEVRFIQGNLVKQMLSDLINDYYEPVHSISGEPIRQLNEYFKGSRKKFTCKLKTSGTPFRKKVWKEMLKIPYGITRSYGEIARRIGKPGAARGVGSAARFNSISIFIPCHRVIGSDGNLVGYRGGLEGKRWLLEHESRFR